MITATLSTTTGPAHADSPLVCHGRPMVRDGSQYVCPKCGSWTTASTTASVIDDIEEEDDRAGWADDILTGSSR